MNFKDTLQQLLEEGEYVLVTKSFIETQTELNKQFLQAIQEINSPAMCMPLNVSGDFAELERKSVALAMRSPEPGGEIWGDNSPTMRTPEKIMGNARMIPIEDVKPLYSLQPGYTKPRRRVEFTDVSLAKRYATDGKLNQKQIALVLDLSEAVISKILSGQYDDL